MRHEVSSRRERVSGVVSFAAAAALLLAFASDASGGNCKFQTFPVGGVAFGLYSPFDGAPKDAASVTFQVFCTPNTTGRLELTTGGSGTFNSRQMTSAGNTLTYNLYTDASRATVWDDANSGATVILFDADSSSKTFDVTIYGRISAGQDAAAGSYSDSVNASLYQGNTLEETYGNIPITATVENQCTVDSFSLNFGTYDPLASNAAAPLDAATSIVAYCTRGTSATISLSAGLSYAAGARRMTGPVGAFMSYNIFTDSARTVEWNSVNTVARTSTSKTVPLGGLSGVPGYGRIPAGQNVRAGNYTDTVVATVNY